jgi:hypothetical protein
LSDVEQEEKKEKTEDVSDSEPKSEEQDGRNKEEVRGKKKRPVLNF